MTIRTAHGLTVEGRRAVEALFEQHLERRWHPGAQLAVYRDGALALDLVGGEAERGRPLEREARMLLFSSVKPVTAVCIHMLRERGLLGYDEPVARHWPEFAQGGKERVTVRHVLTHQGGFPQLPDEFDWQRLDDWQYVADRAAGIPAAWPPGTATGYHSLTYGWALGELIRRVDGRMPREFMREEIFDPLGVEDEISLGLDDADLHRRVPVHATSEVTRRDPEGLEGATSRIAAAYNEPGVARAQMPAVNAFGTARALARFYAALATGGALDGARLLREETLAFATRVHGETRFDRSQEVPKRYGLGFYLSGLEGDPFDFHDGEGAFGHSGQQSSAGYADPRYGLGVAYVTNGLQAPQTVFRRMAEITGALRDACD